MRFVSRSAVVVWMIVLAGSGVSWAEEELIKQDRQGPVTVAVTLTAPPALGSPLRVSVALNTHSVALDTVVFEKVVARRLPEGKDVEPIAVEQSKGSGHHREAVLVFPSVTGVRAVEIVVKEIGGVRERSFIWTLPASR